ncbi:histidine phosphatase family protein [Demetria terragena]|uniref:histidine phosphatase family protein n=1 Tax=Demetria terragena TaxID=63959 RepID=UPI00037D5909|nr:histidine phosphatase family protein [Demetria terragena]
MTAGAPVPGPSERLMRGSQTPRRLIVWRHGETTHNAAGIWQGQLDTELSDRGRDQVRVAAHALRSQTPVLLWSSDLRRARATAEALADVTELSVRTDERLREIHVGEWQGLTAGDVAERSPDIQEKIARGEDPARGVTGETVAQVVLRTREAVAEFVEHLAPGGTGVIATHGVTGRAIVADLAQIDQRVAWMSLAGLHNAHWAELVEHRFGWRISRWNAGAPS